MNKINLYFKLQVGTIIKHLPCYFNVLLIMSLILSILEKKFVFDQIIRMQTILAYEIKNLSQIWTVREKGWRPAVVKKVYNTSVTIIIN